MSGKGFDIAYGSSGKGPNATAGAAQGPAAHKNEEWRACRPADGTVSKTTSSVSMRRAGSKVEIRRFDAVALVLDGEPGRAVYDTYLALPASTRGLYAEGFLHAADMACATAEISMAFVRDPSDTQAAEAELFVRIGGHDRVYPLERASVGAWLSVLGARAAQLLKVRGGA